MELMTNLLQTWNPFKAKENNLVVAIDFGTRLSGYAYAFENAEPKDIKLNHNWANSQGHESFKTRTSVLLVKDEFRAFGFEAEDLYPELTEEDSDEDRNSAKLFKNFKMVLHKLEETKKLLACSADGHIEPALGIFAHALRFLKRHALGHLKNSIRTICEEDIRWVITVPAIWSDKSKGFMRQAACEAGLIDDVKSENLCIALEPEAASFYCRHLESGEYSDKLKLAKGTRYLILDVGGGTTDIVVHEILKNKEVRELCQPSGGPYGGDKVNEAFVSLLKDIFGKTFVENYRKPHSDQWKRMLDDFELLKKKCSYDKGAPTVYVNLPLDFKDRWHSKHITAENRGKYGKYIEEKGYTFRFKLSLPITSQLFMVVKSIIGELNKVLQTHAAAHELDYLFMVGGFSNNPILQDAVKELFVGKKCSVIIPRDAQLAVLKGAVLFWQFKKEVKSRQSRYSYGFESSVSFDAAIHDANRRFEDEDGDVMCNNVYTPIIEKGEDVAIGTRKEKVFDLVKGQNELSVDIYYIERESQKPVEYTEHIDEVTGDHMGNPDVNKLGEIRIQIPHEVRHDESEKRKVFVAMIFGHTEIFVEAKVGDKTEVVSLNFSSASV